MEEISKSINWKANFKLLQIKLLLNTTKNNNLGENNWNKITKA